MVVQQAPGASKNNNNVGANGKTTTCSSADVTLLTDTAFDGDFKTGLRKDVVVYFYKPNPNCPACKKFKPKYDCVATEYKVASDDLLIEKSQFLNIHIHKACTMLTLIQPYDFSQKVINMLQNF